MVGFPQIVAITTNTVVNNHDEVSPGTLCQCPSNYDDKVDNISFHGWIGQLSKDYSYSHQSLEIMTRNLISYKMSSNRMEHPLVWQ